jgi:two-component system sensor histidine kinase KdpD
MKNEKAKDSSRPGPVVVGIKEGASAEGLIGAASAMAEAGGLELECVTVDTGGVLTDEGEARLARSQAAAREAGALVASEPGVDVAVSLLRYARRRAASAIVVGLGRRRHFKRGIAERLVASGGAIPVLAIGAPAAAPAGRRPRFTARAIADFGNPAQFAAAALVVAIATGLNLALSSYAGYWAAAIVYLAAVSISALELGWAAVLLEALLSAVAWDFLFMHPRFTLAIESPADILMLGLYLLLAICSGLATSKLRASERLLFDREARLSRLNELARTLAGTKEAWAIVAKGVKAIEEAIGVEAILIEKDGSGRLKPQAESGWEPLDSTTRSAAELCFSEGRATGRYTELCSSSEWHFVALESPGGRLGVAGVRAASDRRWDESTEAYLKTAVSTVSIALARELG